MSMIRRAFNVLISVKPKSKLFQNYVLSKNVSIYLTTTQFYSSERSSESTSFEDKFDDLSDNENQINEQSKEYERESPKPVVDSTQLKEFYQKYKISAHGNDVPKPMFNFEDYDWPDQVLRALQTEGFSTPTPIQSVGWPTVLSGRDMVGVAQTGSGKTLCYVLPAFVKLLKEPPVRGPKCLVLAPTRELAQQINNVVRTYRLVNSVCLYGGASRVPQIQMLRETNPRIVIATPGRLNDFIESGVVQLNSVNYLVMDEADRMLDMGFEPQIRSVIKSIPNERQTLMWSATWPKEVRQLAASFMNNYVQYNIGGTNLTANRNIKQFVHVCEDHAKLPKLMAIVDQYSSRESGEKKILIFAKTKRTTDFLANRLQSQGKRVLSTHGDKSQSARDFALTEFRSGRRNILVATDVAARGLDVDDINVVINFDYPQTTEDYIHRIGRTGRVNNTGISYTFFTSEDKPHVKDLIEVLRDAGQEVNKELSELASFSPEKGNRVWGYEPRNKLFDKRPFNNRDRNFGNNYNDRNYGNNYSNRRNNYDDDSYKDRGDERVSRNFKKELYNKNYAVNTRRESYDDI